MNFLQRESKKTMLRGKTVLRVDCRGCMAHDHHIEKVGIVVGFKFCDEIWPSDREHNKKIHAVCRVVKTREDVPDEFFYPCIEDGALMPTPNKDAWMWLQ